MKNLNTSQTLTQILLVLKTELENRRKEKLHGHIIRSRAKWVERGGKLTKYFCNLESRIFFEENKTIKRVELIKNRTIYNQSEILQVKEFYLLVKILNLMMLHVTLQRS